MTYTRPQLRLLVALTATLLVGLGVREWRAGFPDLAERLERFDRSDDDGLTGAPPPAAPAAGGRRTRVAVAADEGLSVAPAAPGPLDLNLAGVDELARLPGVGPSLARRIVEERERSGAFDSPESLRRVYGLGPRKLAALRGLVVASRPAGAHGAGDGARSLSGGGGDPAAAGAPFDGSPEADDPTADGDHGEPDAGRDPD